MNEAQKQLLAKLREIVVETPKSGAVNAGGMPLHLTRFGPAVERRADDGNALVAYARAKVHEEPTEGYDALIRAGRPDLTVEAIVADAEAAWASEFTDDDRAAASARLGAMLEAKQREDDAVEAEAVAKDREMIAKLNAKRAEQGKPPVTPEYEARRLEELAVARRLKRK